MNVPYLGLDCPRSGYKRSYSDSAHSVLIIRTLFFDSWHCCPDSQFTYAYSSAPLARRALRFEGESAPSPSADVAGVSPVSAQMWPG